MEVLAAQAEIDQLTIEFKVQEESVVSFASLFSDKSATELIASVKVLEVKKYYENIAGVDIPSYQSIVFEPADYSLFDTPVWLEAAVEKVQDLITIREKIKVAHEKKGALERELREVSIRVNLFEKIMIPRAIGNIKKIKIFLGDQELAAVSQAKLAKRKILMRDLRNK